MIAEPVGRAETTRRRHYGDLRQPLGLPLGAAKPTQPSGVNGTYACKLLWPGALYTDPFPRAPTLKARAFSHAAPTIPGLLSLKHQKFGLLDWWCADASNARLENRRRRAMRRRG